MHSKKCPGSTRAVENCHMIHSLPIGNLNRLIAHLHLASPISSSLCSLHSHLHPCQPQHLSQHFLGSLLLSLYSSHLGVQAPHNVRRREKRLRVKIKQLEQQNKELSIKLQTKDKLISSLQKQLASERVMMKLSYLEPRGSTKEI